MTVKVKLLLKRGNTTQNSNYVGEDGELTFDTTAKQLRMHNRTKGGVIIRNKTEIREKFLLKTDAAKNALKSSLSDVSTKATTGEMHTVSGLIPGTYGMTGDLEFRRTTQPGTSVLVKVPRITVNAQGQVTSIKDSTLTLRYTK